MTFGTIDRANVTSTSTGTESFILDSAVTGYQDFSDVGDTKLTYYTITDGTNWETGSGTYKIERSFFFDGAADYLTLPANTVIGTGFTFGTGDFTVEFWMYPRVTSFYASLFSTTAAETVPNTLRLTTGQSDNRMVVSSSSNLFTASTAFTNNIWSHVALVRSGTDLRLYLNGSSVGSAVNSTNFASDTFRIGYAAGAGDSFPGNISNFRVVKGRALYTSNFTPTTRPLSVIEGTTLLTAKSNTIIDETPNRYTITVNGQVAGNTLVPFSGNNVLSRDMVFDSSSSGSLVNFSAGVKNVFISQPAMDTQGTVPTGDDNSIGTDLVAWKNFQKKLFKSINSGVTFRNNNMHGVMSTYSLVYTTGNAYSGGVLAPNGDIHFVPNFANRGQKVGVNGVVSTYSLIYTTSEAYWGGVLAPNGDIHFIPFAAARGQKISASGVVSTYSLIYTTSSGSYAGGVLAPNGDIHFVPWITSRGQKVSAAGVVSTYSLVLTGSGLHAGGVLAPNGDIHFVPNSSERGQKISAAGVVSTYSLVYTTFSAFRGGVLSPKGEIHFVPFNANRGQKISADGVVSTYSLVHTLSSAYNGGVLAPNGDIHFIPSSATVGQKISLDGVVSTYSLLNLTLNSIGGVLSPSGEIHFVLSGAGRGQKISVCSGIPLNLETCLSPFLNKF